MDDEQPLAQVAGSPLCSCRRGLIAASPVARSLSSSAREQRRRQVPLPMASASSSVAGPPDPKS